jgi:hypothetical protein
MQYLLGYMLALVLSTVAWVWQVNARVSKIESARVQTTAQQAQAIITAAQNYLASNPSGMPTSSGAAPAFIGLPSLVGSPGNLFAGYAAPGCNATYGCPNPYGQQWEVEVSCAYTSCPYSATVSGSGAWTAFLLSFGGSAIPSDTVPRVADDVGANGGNTPMNDTPAGTTNSLSVEGAYAGWSYPLANLYNPGPGHLVCQVQ